MAPFAGYELPLHYKAGVVAEHLHTREKAGLFDVSHMGQAILGGRGAAALIESLVPADIGDFLPNARDIASFSPRTAACSTI